MTDKIKKAKKLLQANGYYTGNLWQVDDVKHNYPNLSEDDCLEVLDRTLQSEYIVSNIFETIDHFAEEIFKEINDK